MSEQPWLSSAERAAWGTCANADGALDPNALRKAAVERKAAEASAEPEFETVAVEAAEPKTPASRQTRRAAAQAEPRSEADPA